MLPSELSIYGYKRPHIFPVEFNPLGNHMIRLSEHQFESLSVTVIGDAHRGNQKRIGIMILINNVTSYRLH